MNTMSPGLRFPRRGQPLSFFLRLKISRSAIRSRPRLVFPTPQRLGAHGLGELGEFVDSPFAEGRAALVQQGFHHAARSHVRFDTAQIVVAENASGHVRYLVGEPRTRLVPSVKRSHASCYARRGNGAWISLPNRVLRKPSPPCVRSSP